MSEIMARPGLKVAGGRRRWLAGVGGLILLIAAAVTVVGYRPIFLGNFGVVDPGVVYRSAQPMGRARWEGLVAERGIASVLNLRGGSRGDAWYVDEVDTTRAAGVDLYDLPMGATRRPSREELLTMVDVLERCRYPLLIHCKSGSDRTGLASALYLMVRRGVPPELASESFTVKYGHVPLGGTQRLHEPIDEYAAWLARNGLAHSAGRFKDWITTGYRSPGEEIGPLFRPLDPGSRWDRLTRRTPDPTSSGALAR
ncbi:tyrosine-protein phosphatase [Isosphaeraceae bacterium EP7]